MAENVNESQANHSVKILKYVPAVLGSQIKPILRVQIDLAEKHYKCRFCIKSFEKACQLGGHMSKKHSNECLNYAKR